MYDICCSQVVELGVINDVLLLPRSVASVWHDYSGRKRRAGFVTYNCRPRLASDDWNYSAKVVLASIEVLMGVNGRILCKIKIVLMTRKPNC